MDQEFLNSRLFRHRLYFKTDITCLLTLISLPRAPGVSPSPHSAGGECAMATIRGQVGGVNNEIFRTHR